LKIKANTNQMHSQPSVKVSVEPSVRGYVLSTLRKVESSDKTIAFIDEIDYFRSRKSTVNRPIPTLASSKHLIFKGLSAEGFCVFYVSACWLKINLRSPFVFGQIFFLFFTSVYLF